MTKGRKVTASALLTVALLCYATMFQGSRGIWERDEGRYTNIALRMLQTGDYIAPAFNDEVPHFAKPPLIYWAIAGGVTLLGWNEWAVRLPNALSFAGTVLLVFAMARRTMPDRRWLPPLIYATSLFPFIAANFVTTDTLLTLWETIAVLGFVYWWPDEERTKVRGQGPAFLTMMWAGFGLAFLTKGPPGLLPLFAILAFVFLAKGWRSILRLFSLTGLATFVVIGLSWYVWVAATHSGLASYFLRDELALRFASGAYHRNPEWYKGFAIYVPGLLIGMLPWTFVLARSALSTPSTLFTRTWWRNRLKGDPWVVFLTLWVLLPLAVFFISKSRLPLYILPLFVPVALIIGRSVVWPSRGRASAYFLAAWIVVLVGLKFAGSFLPYAKDSRAMAQAIASYVQPPPSEIVFVDSDAFWGLSLYLRCEVERVLSSSSTGSPEEGTLLQELKEKEPRTLFVVEQSEEATVTETCRSLGYPVSRLGGRGSWVFIGLPEEFGGGPGFPLSTN